MHVELEIIPPSYHSLEILPYFTDYPKSRLTDHTPRHTRTKSAYESRDVEDAPSVPTIDRNHGCNEKEEGNRVAPAGAKEMRKGCEGGEERSYAD